eukprot:scpid92885/ scgid17347/ 
MQQIDTAKLRTELPSTGLIQTDHMYSTALTLTPTLPLYTSGVEQIVSVAIQASEWMTYFTRNGTRLCSVNTTSAADTKATATSTTTTSTASNITSGRAAAATTNASVRVGSNGTELSARIATTTATSPVAA